MRVKNIDLVVIMNRLDSYSVKKLPQKISYAITRNLKLISNEYEIYAKTLKKIFDAYENDVIKDENGNVMYLNSGIPIVNDAVSTEFNKDISDLLDTVVDVSFYYIPRDVFDYSDDVGRYDAMSAKDIMILESILCDKD